MCGGEPRAQVEGFETLCSRWFGGWVGHLVPVFGDQEGLLGLGIWGLLASTKLSG